MNPPVFPINTPKPGVPQIKVDMVDDVFCVSSNGQYPFFTGEQFSGGVVLWHAKLKVRNLWHNTGLPRYEPKLTIIGNAPNLQGSSQL